MKCTVEKTFAKFVCQLRTLVSVRGIQIEGNVFCPVCECYMSQEIMCNRKNAETQDLENIDFQLGMC